MRQKYIDAIDEAKKIALDAKASAGAATAILRPLISCLHDIEREIGIEEGGHAERLSAIEDRVESLEDYIGCYFVPEGTEPEYAVHRKKKK